MPYSQPELFYIWEPVDEITVKAAHSRCWAILVELSDGRGCNILRSELDEERNEWVMEVLIDRFGSVERNNYARV